MSRAAVLIGVSKSGDLPKLQAVGDGIEKMRQWCKSQGIAEERISVLTDDRDKVTAGMVRDAVYAFVKPNNLEQLIVYFSGHGIYNQSDLWLLSEAQRFANEAVNVEGSIRLARYCGIGHVVFISDACRVAPDSIQATGVTGTEIFPNEAANGMEGAVDAFFACARGKPALEVRQPEVAALEYSAIYTEVLSMCLGGDPLELVEASDSEPDVGVIRAWPLADELARKVPLRLWAKLGKQVTVNQTPTARISSRSAWISRLSRPGILTREPMETLAGDGKFDEVALITGSVETGAFRTMFEESIGTSKGQTETDVKWNSLVGTGVSVSGAELDSVQAAGRVRMTLMSQTNVMDLGLVSEPIATLVECRHGRGALVPVLPGMVTELVFEGGELAKVIHQPGSGFSEKQFTRWEKLGTARKQVNDAAETGMFLASPKNRKFFDELLTAKLVDPSVALHAAYALHAAGLSRDIVELDDKLIDTLSFSPMDLRLLAGMARDPLNPRDVNTWPFLSQAWSLLRSLGVDLPPRLQDFRSCLAPSVWTSFDGNGIRLLRELME